MIGRQRLLERLAHHRLDDVQMVDDGNCQFRAISMELYNTQAHHAAVSAGKEAKDAEAAVAKLERSLPTLRAEVIAAEERAADLEGRLGELEAAAKVTKEDAAELKRLELDAGTMSRFDLCNQLWAAMA